MLTPTYILILFIIVVLAVVWALVTLIRYSATKRSAIFISFVDLCFFGALIAAVYQLRHIAQTSCGSFDESEWGRYFLSTLGPFGYWGRSQDNELANNPEKVCAMLKTSFAFGIMNIVSFFVTAFFAYMIHRSEDKGDNHSRRRSSGRSQGRRRSGSGRRGDYHV